MTRPTTREGGASKMHSQSACTGSALSIGDLLLAYIHRTPKLYQRLPSHLVESVRVFRQAVARGVLPQPRLHCFVSFDLLIIPVRVTVSEIEPCFHDAGDGGRCTNAFAGRLLPPASNVQLFQGLRRVPLFTLSLDDARSALSSANCGGAHLSEEIVSQRPSRST